MIFVVVVVVVAIIVGCFNLLFIRTFCVVFFHIIIQR